MAIQRVGGDDPALQRQHPQQLDDSCALFGFGGRGDLSKDQPGIATPGADHVQRRPTVRRVDWPAQNFAVDGDDARAGLAEPRHESLKACAELVGIELAKYAAEGVVARDSVLKLQEVTEEFLLGFGKYRHVDRGLAARQHRARRYHQNFPKIVAPGI